MGIFKSLKNLFDNTKSSDKYKGYIDRYTDNTLEGWAYLTSKPNKPLNIEIVVDGEVLGETHAQIYRQDLSDTFQTSGKHGFSIQIPKQKKDKHSGIVRLRDKESKRIISTNVFSINYYDFSILYESAFLDYLNQRYKETGITKKSSIEEVAFYYYRTQQIESCRQTLEEAINEQHELTFDLLIMLLRIYVSGSEFTNSATLYQYIKKIYKDDKSFQGVQEIIITFCSSLWKDKVDFWHLSNDVHKLELLIIVFEDLFAKVDNVELLITAAIKSEEQLDNFYARSIKYGILFESFTLSEMMNILIKDPQLYKMNEKVFMKQYTEHLALVEVLWRSTQVQSYDALNDILDQMSHVLKDNDLKHSIRNEINRLFIKYISSLIVSKKIVLLNDLKKVYKVVQTIKQITDDEDPLRKIKVDVVKNDLTYLLDNIDEAYSDLMELIDEHIDYIEWNSTYASEIIYDYETSFINSNRSAKSKKLVWQRYNSGRANVTDALLILIDMLKYKEKHTIDLNKNLKLFSTLLLGVCDTKLSSEKQVEMIKTHIHQLFHGLMDRYFTYAVMLRDKQANMDEIEIFESDLLEAVNMISLARVNNYDKSPKLTGRSFKEFGALIKYNAPNDIAARAQEQCGVLIFMNDDDEQKILDYYTAMLKSIERNNDVYYLLLEKYFYKLTPDKNYLPLKHSYADVDMTAELVSAQYGGYLVVSDAFITHHRSQEIFVSKQNKIFYSSDKQQFSYFIDRKTWMSFSKLIDLTPIKDGKDLRTILFSKMKDAIRANFVQFTKVAAGIISSKAVAEDKVSHLTNFNIPVWEDVNIKETLPYLTQLYSNEKVKNIESINTNDVALNLIKPFEIEEQKDDIACFLVQRNEFLRLEGFLEYYRSFGVDKFYIIDNASDDGKTLEYLLGQKDVELYSTIQAYSQSKYGVKWAEVLIKTKRQDKWSLLVDADELLFFDSEHRSIQGMCKDLDAAGYDSLYSPFLDMYSSSSISDTAYLKGKDILKTCHFYDKHFFTTFTVHGGIKGNLPTYQGGVRSRAFGLNTVVLNKLPLFKYNPYMQMREGLHWIDNCNPLYGKAVLLHFKYIETFHEYVESEAKRGQHWNGASEYKQYLDFMHRNPDYTMYDAVLSAKFTTVENFYQNQFVPLELKEEGKNV